MKIDKEGIEQNIENYQHGIIREKVDILLRLGDKTIEKENIIP